MGPASSMDPVPESVLKKRKTQEKLAADRAAAAAEAKKANKEKRTQAYKSAEKYVKEYRAMAKQRVRMHRQAKAAGNHYVDGEAKLAFEHGRFHEALQGVHGDAQACRAIPLLWIPQPQECARAHLQTWLWQN